ncbi:aspartyl protease family protein [Maricaulis parjimensis]|uniref:aspartyl protease family protein n=1 Tax=Maricaulis parjimensis TaxID=144023 RepID=UPI00193ABB02|nr:aspartyl protease family protein [Maricaulis parjimensis]
MHSILKTGIALAALGLTALPATFALDEDVTLQRAPSGHLLIPVTINGDGPYDFILDTGASHSAVASAVAEQYGFQSDWDEFDQVQALTTRFSAEFFELPNLGYSGRAPANINSVVIPVPEGHPIPVAGLLGADAIGSPRYAIDFALGQLTLDAAAPQRVDGQINSIGLLITTASMRRTYRPVHVLVDSGSARSIANFPLVRAAGSRRMGLRMGTVNGIDGREQENIDTLMVRNVEIGGLCFAGFQMLEGDLDIFRHMGWEDEPALILGMDALQHARITVDRETGTFELAAATNRFDCR